MQIKCWIIFILNDFYAARVKANRIGVSEMEGNKVRWTAWKLEMN